MPRPLRHDPAGGWHHVMNRGVARQRVFFTQGDGQAFERLMAEGHDRFGVDIHAYCLMTNHFHLLVHCPDAGLSKYMQFLGSMYTQHLNRRLQRDGPIFRGRFHSLPIGSERHLATVGRYIHRNPMDIRPPVDLARYRWSSLRYYCNEGVAPPWLTLSLARPHGGAAAYRTFVESDADAGSTSIEWAIATAVAESDLCDTVPSTRIRRTIALLMFDSAPVHGESQMEEAPRFPSSEARRLALHRAKRALDARPELGAVVDRAWALTR